MMLFNFFIWIAENPPRADKSALGAINRPLRIHLNDFLMSSISVLKTLSTRPIILMRQ